MDFIYIHLEICRLNQFKVLINVEHKNEFLEKWNSNVIYNCNKSYHESYNAFYEIEIIKFNNIYDTSNTIQA